MGTHAARPDEMMFAERSKGEARISGLEHVPVASMAPERFSAVLSRREFEALQHLIVHGARELRGRVVWNVNSTAKGGGVAEMLGPLIGYCQGADVDARWLVIPGDPDFFRVTKRLHNKLHGFNGDGGVLGDEEHHIYERTLAPSAEEFVSLLSPNDIVILHDPQTAGLVDRVRATGAIVIWRCHVGLDRPNDATRAAWDFLRPYVIGADAYVFSRAGFAWEDLPRDRLSVIRPSIDAFSPKNAELSAERARAILSEAGIVPHPDAGFASFLRTDGSSGHVSRSAQMIEEQPLTPEDRLVMQVSRWDSLKDPLGVLSAFADHTGDRHDAHLMLVGPSTEAVADDPEGADVFASVTDAWHSLPAPVRRRVHLASLPMDDTEENAVIVNALQRTADIVLQKSLAEGFGLTRCRGDVEATPSDRQPDRRDPRPDRARPLRTADHGPARSCAGRRCRQWLALRPRSRRPARRGRAGTRPPAVPGPASPRPLLRGDPSARLKATARIGLTHAEVGVPRSVRLTVGARCGKTAEWSPAVTDDPERLSAYCQSAQQSRCQTCSSSPPGARQRAAVHPSVLVRARSERVARGASRSARTDRGHRLGARVTGMAGRAGLGAAGGGPRDPAGSRRGATTQG